MTPTNAYLEAVKQIPKEIQLEAAFTFGVSNKIHELLINQGMTQKELAKKMGKTEAEVSVWLSGQHNFTLRTLAKISAVLGDELIKIA